VHLRDDVGTWRQINDNGLASMVAGMPKLKSLFAMDCQKLVSPSVASASCEMVTIKGSPRVAALSLDMPALKTLDVSKTNLNTGASRCVGVCLCLGAQHSSCPWFCSCLRVAAGLASSLGLALCILVLRVGVF